jgi:hypothetical protein
MGAVPLYSYYTVNQRYQSTAVLETMRRGEEARRRGGEKRRRGDEETDETITQGERDEGRGER